MMAQENNNYNQESDFFRVILSLDEKIRCLSEIADRLKKILYVYEKSLEVNTVYDYQAYLSNVLLFVQSCNDLFEGELVEIVVNINILMNNEFEKAQIKRLVFESLNKTRYLRERYMRLKEQ